jgi:hypothetical protein
MRNRRPTLAGVIACLALAIALGGSAFAATMLVPKNSVGSASRSEGSPGAGRPEMKAPRARNSGVCRLRRDTLAERDAPG